MEVGAQVLHAPGEAWGRLRTNTFSSCKQQSWGWGRCFAQPPASEVPWDATARLGTVSWGRGTRAMSLGALGVGVDVYICIGDASFYLLFLLYIPVLGPLY